tara:strand:+ start:761 stop:1180 length:420 start_codon:yes stop_codon:yes gene_type:complete
MKKLVIVLMFLFPIVIISQGNNNSRKFIEANLGLASTYGYDWSEPFPGMSVLFGKTYANNGLVGEWQAGIAAPSIVTLKLFLGGGDLNRNIGIAVRPWPLFVGPQMKVDKFTLSFEVGTDTELSFDSGLIITFGYRWEF